MLHVYRPVLEVLMQRGVQDPHTIFSHHARWQYTNSASSLTRIGRSFITS